MTLAMYLTPYLLISDVPCISNVHYFRMMNSGHINGILADFWSKVFAYAYAQLL